MIYQILPRIVAGRAKLAIFAQVETTVYPIRLDLRMVPALLYERVSKDFTDCLTRRESGNTRRQYYPTFMILLKV